MRVFAIYRTYDGENAKPRLPYYSKLLAFQSFLLSWRQLPSRRLIVAINGPTMPSDLLRLYERYADEVRYIAEKGNKQTYRIALDWVGEAERDDLVYLAEDDYLYQTSAFPQLVTAAERFADVDYFTLYDHLDRYTRTDDARVGRPEFIRLAGDRHWRVVESTCSTYAARASTLKTDRAVLQLLCRTGRIRDRLGWRMTQGIGWWWWKMPKRWLISPIPSLATHMDPGREAPNVDWQAVAERVAADAGSLG
jgi:hypothetical protein